MTMFQTYHCLSSKSGANCDLDNTPRIISGSSESNKPGSKA